MQPDQTVIEPASPPEPAREITPLALYQMALTQAVDPEKLSKLLDLHERIEAKKAEQAYNLAMNRCQQCMPTVVTDAENTHTKKTYARLEAVNRAIKPIYVEMGFSLSATEVPCQREGFLRLRIDVLHTGGHRTEHFGDFPIDGQGAKGGANMNAIQGHGSTISYARRYLTLMIFNVTVSGQDDDGALTMKGIGQTQVAEIEALIADIQNAGIAFNYDAFLKWLNVADLPYIPVKDFAKAVNELKRKRKEGSK